MPRAAKAMEGGRDLRRHRWGMLRGAGGSAPGRLGGVQEAAEDAAALGMMHRCRVTLGSASPEEQKHTCTNCAHACAHTHTHTRASREDGEGARIPPGLLAGTGVTSQRRCYLRGGAS